MATLTALWSAALALDFTLPRSAQRIDDASLWIEQLTSCSVSLLTAPITAGLRDQLRMLFVAGSFVCL